MHDVTKYNRYGRNYTHLRKSFTGPYSFKICPMCTSVTHISLISPAAIGKAITRSLPPAQERVCWVDGPVVFTHFFEKGAGIHFFVVDSKPSTARTPNLGLGLASSSTCFPCGAFSNPCYHAAFVTSQARPRRRPCHHGGLSRWGMGSAWRWGRREGLDDLQRPNPPCSSESGEAVGCSLASSPWWCQNPPCPLPRGMVRSTVAAEAAKSPLW